MNLRAVAIVVVFDEMLGGGGVILVFCPKSARPARRQSNCRAWVVADMAWSLVGCVNKKTV